MFCKRKLHIKRFQFGRGIFALNKKLVEIGRMGFEGASIANVVSQSLIRDTLNTQVTNFGQLFVKSVGPFTCSKDPAILQGYFLGLCGKWSLF